MLTVIDEKVTVTDKCIERTVYLGPSEQDSIDQQAIVNAIAKKNYGDGWREGYKAGVVTAFAIAIIVATIGWIVSTCHN
ncbi:MAG TPA: hypothetical protein VH022_14540 [Candidatus Acidoferrum sp.]|jgi:hypothetical protein|nr:hypothetical protein [Candidatus Acidoferrum sp.]